MKGINEEGYLIIEDRIYTIRGMQVMIDRDIAALYGVETKRLNEQVRKLGAGGNILNICCMLLQRMV